MRESERTRKGGIIGKRGGGNETEREEEEEERRRPIAMGGERKRSIGSDLFSAISRPPLPLILSPISMLSVDERLLLNLLDLSARAT